MSINTMIKYVMSVSLALAMIVGLVACDTSVTVDAPADSSINAENAQYWREVLQNYRANDGVKQIMLVRYTGGCNATVQFYAKLTDENNAWSLIFVDDAYVGKYGINKAKEGDAKTPTGDYGVTTAFGIRSNPGTALEYIDIKETTYACDEDCEYYNQIIDTAETGHECTGEEMYKYTPEYNYGLATDFNSDNEYGLGSEIFIHCKGAKAFTGGCVALDE